MIVACPFSLSYAPITGASDTLVVERGEGEMEHPSGDHASLPLIRMRGDRRVGGGEEEEGGGGGRGR